MSWQPQSAKPLFPDFIWSQPQRRGQTPRVLVVGGNQNSIASPLAIHAALVGKCQQLTIAIPDVLKRQLKGMDQLLFCPSNQSGSFGGDTLEVLTTAASSHDYLVIAGDITSNSQSLLMIKQLLDKVNNLTIISSDIAQLLLEQQAQAQLNQIWLLDTDQLQRYLTHKQLSPKLTSLPNIASQLQNLPVNLQLLAPLADQWWVKVADQLSSTAVDGQQVDQILAKIVLYIGQATEQIFESLTSAVYPAQETTN